MTPYDAAMDNPWTTRRSRPIYDNPWIQVTEHDVLNPAGGDGIYGVVSFKNHAVGVVPIDDEGNTWLVGQYRYTLNAYAWEIPEGGSPKGEDPLAGAQRELREETGLTARDWSVLIDTLHTSNSVTDEAAIVYLARGLTLGPAQPEDTERLDIRRVPLTEAVDMALDGRITDAISVAALLKLALQREARGL